ncbi:alpha carbonic anhydrase [Dunaliella salina]|uniref:carbonic anhydrase n=1 Tax=Dunaliella salina TaxID=3046 RepID=A0A172R2D0_DUNSA|nr:carbonic anhydrase 5 [Dunaliella salina]KAF5841505.1 alpha carbonic anhydrase [Dunaliella salina]|eukprot:KAF5841505.1 alpha carbonic anhydrase [Dunaliella salina]
MMPARGLCLLGALFLSIFIEGQAAGAAASGATAVGRQLKAPNEGYNYIRHGFDWPNIQNTDGSATYPTCSGNAQSPIDIDMSQLVDESQRQGTSGVTLNDLNVDAGSGGLSFTQARVKQIEQELRVDFTASPTDNLPTITIDGTDMSFTPLQFHFHHFLSEHTINGVHYPLESHIVMKDSSNLEASDGQLAVIGVMYKYTNDGAGDAFLNSLETQIRTKIENGDATYGEMDVPIDNINAKADLLPSSLEYVGYDGSLTTPPCDERVKWHVFTTPRMVTIDQMKFFMNVTMEAHSDAALVNNRVLQDLNGRKVYKYGF